MTIDNASLAWVLVSTALIWIMIPGIGLFYSGMGKRTDSLAFLWLSLMAIAVTSVQWFTIGYSLTFSLSGSRFIGDFAHIVSINVLDNPTFGTGPIPDIAFSVFHLMFAGTATTIVTGAVSERGRILPTILFVFVWCTLVYNFVAHWIWSPLGWANTLGALDFAGGAPVHIAAGTAALIYSRALGKCQLIPNTDHNRAQDINSIFIGTALSWFGWLGFNGGSGLMISSRAVLACVVTNLSASMGGLTWCLLDYFLFHPKYKLSVFGFCMGAMAGLVCITPGSGYVGVPASFVFGICGSVGVYFARRIKHLFKIDDEFDIFAQHGVGGFIGCLLTGIFAQRHISELDQTSIAGGWLDGHWIQLAYQLSVALASFLWSAVVTTIIIFIMNRIPVLDLRLHTNEDVYNALNDQFSDHIHTYNGLSVNNTRTQNISSINSFITVATVNHSNFGRKKNDMNMSNMTPLAITNKVSVY